MERLQRLRKALTIGLIGFVLVAIVSKLLPVPFGIFIVPTRSMVPVIHPGDMVIVYGKHARVGDIVVWCTSALYCVVHRLIEIRDGVIVTKGDANPVPDNPVPVSRLKGKVVAIVPRYIWIPLLLLVILIISAPSIVSVLEREEVSPIAIAAGVFGFYVVLAAVMPLLYTSMSIAMLGYVKPPLLYLAKIGFDSRDCAVTIHYVGTRGLRILSVNSVTVDHTKVDTYVTGNNTLHIYLPPVLLSKHVEESSSPRLSITVDAVLTRLGHLKGKYSVVIPFKPLKVAKNNGKIVILNPNCYPLHVNITFLYAYSPGSPWRKASDQVIVDKVFEASPPSSARFVYAIVSYRAYGHVYSYKLRLK